MVQEALLTAAAVQGSAASLSSAVPRARTLVCALRRLGLQPLLRAGACGYEAPHIGIQRQVLTSAADRGTLKRELARIRALLFARCAVTVSLPDAGAATPRDLERSLRQLQRATDAPCIDRRLLGISLPAAQLPLPAYLLMSRVLLGDGPRYVMLDDVPRTKTPGTHGSSSPAPFSTLYLHRLRARALSPVYGACLRSRCALLPDERGQVVNTAFAMLVPADSAWLPLSINVCRYCDHRGRLRERQLFAALRAGLRLADALFDELYWPDAKQRQDAHCNRRIAVVLQGLGDLLVLQRANPSGIASLQQLDRLVAKIHDCLWSESHSLAQQRGMLPALTARDPSRGIKDHRDKRAWHSRWQEALERTAVRHRNLLVMSPYALLPSGIIDSAAYADLLPILAYADALSFAGAPRFTHWRYRDYRAFHLRAMAVMYRRNAASFVAARV